MPRKYRVPIVLCYLQGQTNEAAARYLRCPPGTIKTRLARGRALLRERLEQRGLAISASGLAALLAPETVQAAVAPRLADTTLHAASLCVAGPAASTAAPLAALVEGGLRELLLAKLRVAAGVFLFLALLGAGAGLLTYGALTANSKPVAADESGSVGRGNSGR